MEAADRARFADAWEWLFAPRREPPAPPPPAGDHVALGVLSVVGPPGQERLDFFDPWVARRLAEPDRFLPPALLALLGESCPQAGYARWRHFQALFQRWWRESRTTRDAALADWTDQGWVADGPFVALPPFGFVPAEPRIAPGRAAAESDAAAYLDQVYDAEAAQACESADAAAARGGATATATAGLCQDVVAAAIEGRLRGAYDNRWSGGQLAAALRAGARIGVAVTPAGARALVADAWERDPIVPAAGAPLPVLRVAVAMTRDVAQLVVGSADDEDGGEGGEGGEVIFPFPPIDSGGFEDVIVIQPPKQQPEPRRNAAVDLFVRCTDPVDLAAWIYSHAHCAALRANRVADPDRAAVVGVEVKAGALSGGIVVPPGGDVAVGRASVAITDFSLRGRLYVALRCQGSEDPLDRFGRIETFDFAPSSAPFEFAQTSVLSAARARVSLLDELALHRFELPRVPGGTYEVEWGAVVRLTQRVENTSGTSGQTSTVIATSLVAGPPPAENVLAVPFGGRAGVVIDLRAGTMIDPKTAPPAPATFHAESFLGRSQRGLIGTWRSTRSLREVPYATLTFDWTLDPVTLLAIPVLVRRNT
jgi:hypothetical protein